MEILVGKHRLNDRGKLLHLGIIDYLQTYSTKKKFERAFKQIKRRGADVNTFSVSLFKTLRDRESQVGKDVRDRVNFYHELL